MTRIRTIIAGLLAAIVLAYGLWIALKWTVMRVYVGPDEVLLVTNKFGKQLPPDRITVPIEDASFKGVREEVFGPGRYFLNPVAYDWQIRKQVQIPAGDPHKWDWTYDGKLKDPTMAPMIGIVSLKEGKVPTGGHEVVEPGEKGIQKDVLTPGTYKINPYRYEVKLEPAVVVPPGSVGVVTRLSGDVGPVNLATLSQIRASSAGPATQPEQIERSSHVPSRLVSGTEQRGILKDVLQPGIYYLNPRMVKVTIVPIGYDQITLDHNSGTGIRFYTSDGYQVEADFTVVWGRSPADAPNIVANIGSIDRVRENVIEPAMKAACQNEGAKYGAKELIQGATRSKFQDDLSAALEKQVASRNIHVLLALIRNIAIKDTAGKDQTEGLLATIQRANIEIERDLTNKQKTQTAMVAAQLEQARKLVDVARETVASDTGVKVANLLADGNKQAAEIGAQRDLDIADIALEVAQLDSQRTQILGKAAADVDRLRNEAEAKGAKMLIDAFGSPQAYNQYIFAKNFDPQELRLIFAGPGTFWTDLKTFEQVGASKVMQQSTTPAQPEKLP
ncbi:MAG: SPFH domain-containing protein [Tepidisphaeraceae bacterium]